MVEDPGYQIPKCHPAWGRIGPLQMPTVPPMRNTETRRSLRFLSSVCLKFLSGALKASETMLNYQTLCLDFTFSVKCCVVGSEVGLDRAGSGHSRGGRWTQELPCLWWSGVGFPALSTEKHRDCSKQVGGLAWVFWLASDCPPRPPFLKGKKRVYCGHSPRLQGLDFSVWTKDSCMRALPRFWALSRLPGRGSLGRQVLPAVCLPVVTGQTGALDSGWNKDSWGV